MGVLGEMEGSAQVAWMSVENRKHLDLRFRKRGMAAANVDLTEKPP